MLENFINACIEFSTSIEMWYNESSSSSINVFENADLVLHTLKQLKEEYRKANNEKRKAKDELLQKAGKSAVNDMNDHVNRSRQDGASAALCWDNGGRTPKLLKISCFSVPYLIQ